MRAPFRHGLLTLAMLSLGACAQKRDSTVKFSITNMADFVFTPGGFGLLRESFAPAEEAPESR